MVLIDSYSETNQNDNFTINDIVPPIDQLRSGLGQSFTMLTSNHKLTSVKLYIKKVGSPTTNIYAKLFAHTGTYGTDSLPTGSALATSDAVATAGIGTSHSLITFTFSGAQQYEMQANTYYCITFGFATSGLDVSNYIHWGIDTSSPSHSGNAFHYYNSVWGYPGEDGCFYVYGDALAVGGAVSKNLLVMTL